MSAERYVGPWTVYYVPRPGQRHVYPMAPSRLRRLVKNLGTGADTGMPRKLSVDGHAYHRRSRNRRS